MTSTKTHNYIQLNNTKAREAMLRFMLSLKLIDVWRAQNADMNKYTWYQSNPIKMARLDYFLISSNIYNRAGVAKHYPWIQGQIMQWFH
jgi:exonuclease III